MTDLDPFAGFDLRDLRVDVEANTAGAKVAVTHIPTGLVGRAAGYSSQHVARREALAALAEKLRDAYGACTHDAWGADFGVQAGAACVNLDPAHRRALHGKKENDHVRNV